MALSADQRPASAPPTDRDASFPIPRLYTLTDLARALSISKRQIHRDIRTGEFPQPIWIGRKSPRWIESDLVAWFAAQRGVRYQSAFTRTRKPLAQATGPRAAGEVR